MASDLPKGRRTAPCSDSGSVTEEDACDVCEAVAQEYSRGSSDENIFKVHTKRSVVKSKIKTCKDKRVVLDKIKQCGAALRNSRGGSILVHLDGQDKKDRSLEYFDEFLSKELTALIEDGTLFVNVFKREWLSASDYYQNCTDFVLLRVGKTKSISTVDFNTKVRNDIENENATIVNIVSLLSDKDGEKCVDAKLRHLPEIFETFHESRHVEHKAFMPKLAKNPKLTSDEDSLLDYLWSNLKLKDNITSFSKIIGGGSLFIGIAEKTDESTHFKVMKGVGFNIVDTSEYSLKEVPTDEVFELHINKESFLAKLRRKINQNTSILYASGRFATEIPSGLIKLKFHKCSSSNRYILEVAVGYIEGIVFSDKQGPRTYFVKGSSKEEMVCERMAVKDWISRLKRHCILCKS